MKKLFLSAVLTGALLTSGALAEEMSLSSAPSLIAVGVLLVAMAVALVFSVRRVKWNAAMIAKAAICLAMSLVLGMLRLFRMPTGGSITLAASLPLILFAYAFGPLEGVLTGCAFGLLKLILDPYIIHPVQLLVDYPMTYAALSLACLATILPIRSKLKLPVAALLGYFGRYAMAVLSGVVFFAEYAGEQNALIYSIVYNLSYLGPEALICALVLMIPGMTRLPTLLNPKLKPDK